MYTERTVRDGTEYIFGRTEREREFTNPANLLFLEVAVAHAAGVWLQRRFVFAQVEGKQYFKTTLRFLIESSQGRQIF